MVRLILFLVLILFIIWILRPFLKTKNGDEKNNKLENILLRNNLVYLFLKKVFNNQTRNAPLLDNFPLAPFTFANKSLSPL